MSDFLDDVVEALTPDDKTRWVSDGDHKSAVITDESPRYFPVGGGFLSVLSMGATEVEVRSSTVDLSMEAIRLAAAGYRVTWTPGSGSLWVQPSQVDDDFDFGMSGPGYIASARSMAYVADFLREVNVRPRADFRFVRERDRMVLHRGPSLTDFVLRPTNDPARVTVEAGFRFAPRTDASFGTPEEQAGAGLTLDADGETFILDESKVMTTTTVVDLMNECYEVRQHSVSTLIFFTDLVGRFGNSDLPLTEVKRARIALGV